MNTQSPNLKYAIQHLESLPAMPVIAHKILTLPLETEQGEAQLLKLIGQDPQIAARIIGLSNSPLFGLSKHVTSIHEAALLLGLTRIKSVAVGIAVMSTYSQHPAGVLNLQDLWLHSLGVAFGMQVLAHAMPYSKRPQDDAIFLAGLLHDIGFMVLNHLDTRRSDLLHSRLAAYPERSVTEVEAEVIEIGHAEMGAELAQHWNLPPDIVAVLRYHHTPEAPKAAQGQPLVRLINLTEKLLPSFAINETVGAEITDEHWLALGIPPSDAEELTQAVREQAEQARQIAAAF